MTERPEQSPGTPLVLADHPVLDMLNTVATIDGTAHDFWQTDADVVDWFALVGMQVHVPDNLKPGALFEAAKRLREAVRALVQARKSGGVGDATLLNGFLREAASYAELVWSGADDVRVLRHVQKQSAAQLLGPLSEQAAELISQGDFQLIRQCEHPECSLWFYDRTKSHRRRWCSMALCGNRHKVAEHRKRQRQG